MRVQKYQDEQEWLNAREGLITGTRLKDILPKQRGTGYRAGFYEILALRVAVPPSAESPMDRGKRLEEEAMEEFEKATGKKVNKDLVIWFRDDDENIAISPDGSINSKEAVEVKCLSSAKHLEAWLTKMIPSEYEAQVIQYFIVNEKLETLYFVFYDPRLPRSEFHLEVKREEVADKIEEYLEFEKQALAKLKELEDKLTFTI